MCLEELSIKHKQIFDNKFRQNKTLLNKYSFASLFLDKAFFKVLWREIDSCICVFAQQPKSFYMLMPPLGKINARILHKCFFLMDQHNKDTSISRIENVDNLQKQALEKLGLKTKRRFCDYIYKKDDLINLKGQAYKSKRSACNHFVKNYSFGIVNLQEKFATEALKLYKQWAREKGLANDDVARALAKENYYLHKLALENLNNLNLEGLAISINRSVKAYTLGYRLNREVFCILCEISHLKIKGIAQYIFRQMCLRRKEKFINVMDDCGLEYLRRVKLSYHPVYSEENFVATRS